MSGPREVFCNPEKLPPDYSPDPSPQGEIKSEPSCVGKN